MCDQRPRGVGTQEARFFENQALSWGRRWAWLSILLPAWRPLCRVPSTPGWGGPAMGLRSCPPNRVMGDGGRSLCPQGLLLLGFPACTLSPSTSACKRDPLRPFPRKPCVPRRGRGTGEVQGTAPLPTVARPDCPGPQQAAAHPAGGRVPVITCPPTGLALGFISQGSSDRGEAAEVTIAFVTPRQGVY